jgi:hypothetical protein
MKHTLQARRDTRVVPALARHAGVDAIARRLLGEACAPLGFDRAGLAAAVASFPVPRDLGQDTTSGTWGRIRHAHGIEEETHSVLGGAGLGFREGRTFRMTFGPGVAVAASFDACRRERAYERGELAVRRDVNLRAAGLAVDPTPMGEIMEWSSKSRARMVKGFASVDWSSLARCYCGEPMAAEGHSGRCDLNASMPLAMVTLTYPGDWLAVAANGRASKRHLAMFRRRWFRALGWRLDGAWKLEFQRPRGWRADDDKDYGLSTGEEAPHFHLLCPVPALVDGQDFRLWLSVTWADVVGATGQERINHEAAGTGVDFAPVARMSDPKRLAVYFLKHGTKSFDGKAYQHNVPEAWQGPGDGPGRFWGFWGLKPATVALDLDLDDWITARRSLRRVAAARARTVKYSRAFAAAVACGRSSSEAARLGVDSARGRKLRTLGVGGQLSGGWVVVNDGPALAAALARAVLLRRSLY